MGFVKYVYLIYPLSLTEFSVFTNQALESFCAFLLNYNYFFRTHTWNDTVLCIHILKFLTQYYLIIFLETFNNLHSHQQNVPTCSDNVYYLFWRVSYLYTEELERSSLLKCQSWAKNSNEVPYTKETWTQVVKASSSAFLGTLAGSWI